MGDRRWATRCRDTLRQRATQLGQLCRPESASHCRTVASNHKARPRAATKSGSGSSPARCQRSTVGSATPQWAATPETPRRPSGCLAPGMRNGPYGGVELRTRPTATLASSAILAHPCFHDVRAGGRTPESGRARDELVAHAGRTRDLHYRACRHGAARSNAELAWTAPRSPQSSGPTATRGGGRACSVGSRPVLPAPTPLPGAQSTQPKAHSPSVTATPTPAASPQRGS